MNHTIRFSVHRNPKPNADGSDTYHVRHESLETIGMEQMKGHLQFHNAIKPSLFELAFSELRSELAEHLLENRRIHLEGLGTFFLKLGFCKREDEEGNEQPLHFDDPQQITGNEVVIDSVGFQPDKEFMDSLGDGSVHFENVTGRGRVGHSALYDESRLASLILEYIDAHGYTTRRTLMLEFHLTDYMARKWLSLLSEGTEAPLRAEKVGNIYMYRRR